MYELNRARLVGVGPRGARYADVTLNLAGAGADVGPATLLGPTLRRPSPVSLLMLENGGGKTVLLKLLFSVVLPGKRKVVGGPSASLENFVLDSDTGHVAMEWMNVETGELVVTAKVLQRRARAAAGTNPVAEAWYSFRPVDDVLTLDILPVADDGRRRRLDGIRDHLNDLTRAHAALQLTWVGDDQGQWVAHLRSLGLEPDLFNIQRSMNVDEGDAANAFAFKSSGEFIDWLLRTVTDPADAVAVADNFDKWSATLADRDTMLLERDFLDGAIAGLDPLAEAHREARDAAAGEAAARGSAHRLEGQLAARRDQERLEAADRDEELLEARGFLTPRTTERDRARDIINEIRRQTIGLRLQQARAEVDGVADRLAAAELATDGWNTVPLVADAMDADARAAAAAAVLQAAADEAAPALRARDRAAGQLLAALTAAARTADADSDDQEASADERNKEAAGAHQEYSDALTAASTNEERLAAARRTIASAAGKLTAAVTAGLVPPGTTAARVPAETETAEQAVSDTRRDLKIKQDAVADLKRRLTEARHTEGPLAAAAHTAATRAETARAHVQAAEADADRVGALPAVRDVLGGEPITADELDDRAEAVLDALAAAIDGHEQTLAELRRRQHDDQRVLDALGNGGLLPPRREVDDAVTKLRAAGIAAHPGWRYLAETARADQRPDLVAAHPELADGIVLTDPAQLPAAHDLLLQARLLPAAAVAVGTGAALLSLALDPDDARFVIETTPAIYDEQAAAERRDQLADTMAARAASIDEADGQVRTLRDVTAQLSEWRRRNPPGHPAVLRRGQDDADARADDARREHELVQQRVTHLEVGITAADEELDAARGRERAAADRLRDLHALAEVIAGATEAEHAVPGLVETIRLRRTAAAEADSRQRGALTAAERHRFDAEKRRGDAARHRWAMTTVESSTGAADDTVPDKSLVALESAYEAASAAYRDTAPGNELKRKADEAAAEAQKLRNELALRDRQHVDAARILLAGPDGADRALWERAAAAVRADCAQLRQRRNELGERVGALTAELKQASPGEEGRTTWIQLPEEWRPTSPAHGDDLLDHAGRVQREAQAALDEVTTRVETLTRRLEDAKARAAAFDAAYRPLEAVLPKGVGEPPSAPEAVFAGTAEDAEEAAARAREALRETAEAAQNAERAEQAAHRELIDFTRQEKYEQMRNPLRTALLNSSIAVVAANAAEWSGQMLARRTSLQGELDDALRHRGIIVGNLATLVEQALRTVRLASKLSRLPDGLGDWGGREFLQIRFSQPEPAAIGTRVGDLVDTLAADRDPTRPGPRAVTRRDGFSLLLAAVHAAVPNGFAVAVLKPDQVLRDERVAVENMNAVFSGGQELTAAILLYCTLAALKANDHGRFRSRHAGVLFLDNPIGKASARYLLDMQTMVAAALGVQLVYTTGLSDDRALAAFPLWIRMRNDADLRAGLKYIRVAGEMRRVLPGPFDPATDPAGQPGTVTATRIHVRRADDRPAAAASASDTAAS